MGWQTLKEFHSWEEIEAYQEQHNLPAGTKVRVIYEGIDTITCMAFDSFAGEWLNKVPAGFILDDVHCDNGDGYVEATVAGSVGIGFWFALAAIALLAGTALWAFSFIICRLQALLEAIGPWAAIAIVAVSAAIVLTTLIRKRKG